MRPSAPDAPVVVVGSAAAVIRPLQHSGLDKLLSTYRTLDKALTSRNSAP